MGILSELCLPWSATHERSSPTLAGYAGQAELAWQLYLQQQQAGGPVVEILQLIANDCYRAGAWLWAARAFDALECLNIQPGSTSVWDGKRGACVAVFQEATSGEQPAEVLRYVQAFCFLLPRVYN